MDEIFLLILQIFSAGVLTQNPVVKSHDTIKGSINPEHSIYNSENKY